MKKIIFDKDGKMLGIGLYDELLYKKKEHDWKKSKWDLEHIGSDKVSDILSLKITSQTPPLIMKGSDSGSKETLKLIDMLPPWRGPPTI